MKSLIKIGLVARGNQRTCASVINSIRSFSSHDERKPPKVIFGLEIDSTFVWPETKLGILAPKDPRFPFPGIVGPELPKVKKLNHNFDLLTKEQNHERQSNILEQFLAVNEQPQQTGIEFGNVFEKFKYSAEECPYFIVNDLNRIFPTANLSKKRLTMINIYLKDGKFEDVDHTVEFGDAASQICKCFHELGFWADFIDPKAERPHLGHGITDASSYETDKRYKRATVELQNHKGCTLIAHKQDQQFVGCLVTTAPMHHPIILGLNILYTTD